MSNKRVTMKQIAEKAGTSIGTVDRALSNREGISPKTKAHVLQIAEEMGYTRNHIASALSRKRKFKIAIISAKEPAGFYAYINEGIRSAADNFKDYGVDVEVILSENLDPKEQLKLLQSFNHTNYDAIAINSAGEPIGPYITRIVNDGIPVVTFNSDSPDSNRLAFIGNNARQSGRLGGELLGKFLNNSDGSVAVIGNFLNTTTFTERFGGFSEMVQANFPNLSIQLWAECYSQPGKAYDISMDMINKNPDIKGIFSTGYSATIGIINALKTMNRKDIKLVGYDVCPVIIEALTDGWCTATIYQEPYQQAYQAIRLLTLYLLGEWQPDSKNLFVETKVIMASNVYEYSEAHLRDNPFR